MGYNALIYALGNFLCYLASFLLVPLYTRVLPPSEFGGLELLNRLGEILNLCLLFPGLRLATLTFYNQGASAQERREVFTATFFLLLFTNLFGLVVIAVSVHLCRSEWLTVDPFLMTLAGFAAILDGTVFVLLAVLQARDEAVYFVSVTVCQLVARLVLAYVLIVLLGLGLPGIFYSAIVTSVAVALFLVLREHAHFAALPSVACVGSMLRFCLPFLPGGLCFFVINNGDRFFLYYYADASSVGTYALGYKMAAAVSTLGVSPFLLAWGARIYAVAKQGDAAECFGRKISQILACYCVLGLGVSLFQDELILAVAGPGYAAAAPIIPVVLLAYWFLNASSLMDAAFYVRRCTRYKAWINLSTTVATVLFYALLIPSLGPVGAAYATLAGFLIQALLTRVISQRIMFIGHHNFTYALTLGMVVAAWGFSRIVPDGLWLAPVKVILWLACVAVFVAAGLLPLAGHAGLREIQDRLTRLGRRIASYGPGRPVTRP